MRTLEANSRRKAPRSRGSGSKRDPLRRPGPTDKRPTKRQLGNIRSLEKRLKRRRRWVHNRAEATYYFGELRRELNRREARAERERNPDQWTLPAAATQLSELRQLGIPFAEPLTRREAHDLIDGAPATRHQLSELHRLRGVRRR